MTRKSLLVADLIEAVEPFERLGVDGDETPRRVLIRLARSKQSIEPLGFRIVDSCRAVEMLAPEERERVDLAVLQRHPVHVQMVALQHEIVVGTHVDRLLPVRLDPFCEIAVAAPRNGQSLTGRKRRAERVDADKTVEIRHVGRGRCRRRRCRRRGVLSARARGQRKGGKEQSGYE